MLDLNHLRKERLMQYVPAHNARYDKLGRDIKQMLAAQSRLEDVFGASLYRRMERYLFSSYAKSRNMGCIDAQASNLSSLNRKLIAVEKRSRRLMEASEKKKAHLPSYITRKAEAASKAKSRLHNRSERYATLKARLEHSTGNVKDFMGAAMDIESVERSISLNYHRYIMANDSLAPAKAESDLAKFYEGVLNVTLRSAERMRNLSSLSESLLRRVAMTYNNIDNKDVVHTLRGYVGAAGKNVCSMANVYGKSLYALDSIIRHRLSPWLIEEDISDLEQSVGDIIDSTLEWNSGLDDAIETIKDELF